jgi:predicted signal transduction protein with EAL and GGDEF domain
MGEGDTVARMGGDEFAILTSRFAEPAELAQFGSTISRALREPFQFEEHELTALSCAGISVFPDDAADAETMLRHADFALSEAKARGPGRRRFFAGEMNARASERIEMETQLRQALERNELVLFFQPQIELATRRLIGVEALLRWQRPEVGLVAPDRFIPLAEESELIVPIGEWVLAQACSLARRWEVNNHPLRVAVNVSAVQFRRRNFVERVGHILGQSGVSPSLIELEMTESAVMEDSSRTIEHLQALEAMGVRLAIDDFGTGYSSLAYLKRFPLHQLKIDRSFVRDLPGNREDAAIAGAVLALARSLDLAVVAEGVESEAQQAFLHLLGCQIGQGYYYAKPLPLAELEVFRERWQAGS